MQALPVEQRLRPRGFGGLGSRGSFPGLGRVLFGLLGTGSPSAGETTGSGSVAAAGAVLTGTAGLLLLPHLNQRHVEHADDQK